ncbi:MAG TPA: hypothetical protein DCZ75_03850 [Geobacter sp.]|nr:hypothetical protein [Geobacter sp.]
MNAGNICNFTLLFLLLSIVSNAHAAGLPQFKIDRQQSFKTEHLENIPNLKSVLEDELVYSQDSSPQVFLYDLNQDGSCEILIKSHESLCSSGGCLYIMIDGKSRKRLGELFGDPVIVLRGKAGQSFPDIQAYTRSGAGTGTLETFRYSNAKYRSVSSEDLSGKRQRKYLEEIRKIPVRESEKAEKQPM